MCAKLNDKMNLDIIAARLEACKKDEGNCRVFFKGFEHEDLASFLMNIIQLSDEIPEAEKLGIINDCTFNAGKDGIITSKSILKEVSKLENSYLRKPKIIYKFMTTMSIDRWNKMPRKRYNGVTITFYSYTKKEFLVGYDDVIERASAILPIELPKKYKIVLATVSARTIFEASEKAQNSIDELRGVWNLFLNRKQYRRSSSGKRMPVNKIVIGPLHTVHKKSGEIISDVFWYEPSYFGEIKTIDLKDNLKKIMSFEKKLRSRLSKHGYIDIIKDCIIRYTRALDDSDWETCYIKLWSVLERLTNTNLHNTNYNQTIKRASFLYQERGYHRQILNHLRHIRNSFIHTGSGRNNIEVHIYQLKQYIETLLIFHIFNPFRILTIDNAAEFLDSSDDPKYLKAKIRLMNNVLKYISK